MKNILLLLFLVCLIPLYAQQEHPPLYLEYDTAGNQIVSDLVCINCPEVEIAEKYLLDEVRYYPNPVQQQLILSWKPTDDDRVSAVRVYSLSGKALNTYDVLNQDTTLSLPFGRLPSGMYLVEVVSSNGQKKTLKILKQ